MPSSQRLRSRTSTRRAGKLTPAASVGVAVSATKRPDLKAASTSLRCALVKPA